mmetsp:Transcript_41446/g.110906  ORF Transcript_41446/g.110906 Transcript_41446/m.110906 type:complete len:243 (+) Transcript_41446:189-917(+)
MRMASTLRRASDTTLMHCTRRGQKCCIYRSKPPFGSWLQTDPIANKASWAEVVFCMLKTCKNKPMNLSTSVLLLASVTVRNECGSRPMQICSVPHRIDCHSHLAFRSSALRACIWNVAWSRSPRRGRSWGATKVSTRFLSAISVTLLSVSKAVCLRLASLASGLSAMPIIHCASWTRTGENSLGESCHRSWRFSTRVSLTNLARDITATHKCSAVDGSLAGIVCMMASQRGPIACLLMAMGT